MLFSSLIFLFVFLPLVLLGYYCVRIAYRNAFLFASSLVFFAWGGVSLSFVLLVSLVFNYFLGKAIEHYQKNKIWLAIGVSINLSLLVFFKYANFIADNLNLLSDKEKPLVDLPDIALPIGISFYTFQAISYLVDIYRDKGKTQHEFTNIGLYIAFFPQLIAGPIVRYHDIEEQLAKRTHSWQNFHQGINRFTLGLGKKMLVANPMGNVADLIFALPANELNTAYAWIAALAYTLQIYVDFSAYSDMALGLARMFGFKLLENFNYPYLSTSIQDFWRRWHISLSNWFRDYLYISLGGNRVSKSRNLFNLLMVFVVTGFWHGASWNFLLWGLLHGFFLIQEKLWLGKWLKKAPVFITRFYTLFVVVMAWMLFRIENLDYLQVFYANLFSWEIASIDTFFLIKLINAENVFWASIALFGSFGFFRYLESFKHYFKADYWRPVFYTFQASFIVLVIVLSVSYLVAGSYNPFIYFRF